MTVRVKQALLHAMTMVDRSLAGIYLAVARERPGLLTFLFHGLLKDSSEAGSPDIHPQQRTTVDDFRRFVAYYRRTGYQFVSARDVLGGLDDRGRYVMITFDDGYANNLRSLEVLREFDVPATFYISAGNVRDGRCFIADVCWREFAALGHSAAGIHREWIQLMTHEPFSQDEILRKRFGPDAMRPRGELDRPMTPAELRALAADPHVHIGNHTLSHASLTHCGPAELRRQIVTAQEEIQEMTGVRCESIAYPYGHYNAEVLSACREAGLRLGITIDPGKNRLPIDQNGSHNCLRLSRCTIWGGRNIESQCRMFRSDFLLYPCLRAWARG